MPPLPQDSKVEKWLRWLEKIQREVISMHGQRDTYRTVARITQDHGQLPPSRFFDYLSMWYAGSQAVAVRRQAEVSPRVVSLGSLLAEILRDPERMSAERHIALGEEQWQREMLAGDFQRDFGGSVGEHVDPALVQADLDALTVGAERTKEWVDRHVAHTDIRELPAVPTFAEINEAIDTVGVTFNRYSVLFHAASWHTLEPVVQYDWTAPFREPWIRPGREADYR